MRPRVSVLIDTYNHERFVEKAISSVLEQDSAAEREIIVVDDGSTDATAEIVGRFAPEVRYVRKENGGQASAFNTGIAECGGEIVAFLDGDDWWAPEKLSRVVAAFDAEPAVGLVGHGITEVFLDGSERTHTLKDGHRFRLDSLAGALLFRRRKSFLGTSRMALRREALEKVGIVPGNIRIQADEFIFSVAALYAEVRVLPEALTFYRIHDSNAFMLANPTRAAVRLKASALENIAVALEKRFAEEKVSKDIRDAVIAAVRSEGGMMRLSIENAPPWDTVRTEWTNYEILHEHASFGRRLFKALTLLPALVMPSQSFVRWKRAMAGNRTYRGARERVMPFAQQAHVEERSGPTQDALR